MRYYFFKTMMKDRGNGPQPTLRALPGQTFPDGTPVSEELNVAAPKEKGSSSNGSRLDYPLGTVFCSDHLEKIRTFTGTEYYTVYDIAAGKTPGGEDPDFHPVSEDPDFKYSEPSHRNDTMNLAYVKFQLTGEQESGDPQRNPAGTAFLAQGPADKNGRALKPNPTWEETYDDQITTETNLLAIWMKRVLNTRNITSMAKRPKADVTVTGKVRELYSCGENADTLISMARFDSLMKSQRMDATGLRSIAAGPLEWYLDVILQEHRGGRDCSAVRRNPDEPASTEEVVFTINTEMNNTMAVTNQYEDEDIEGMKEVIRKGWTLNLMLNPDILNQAMDITELIDKLYDDSIPLPASAGASGMTLIEKLMSDNKNARPDDSEGFHVDELTWKILVRNLNRKKATVLTGPTGSGKTELVRMLCERTGTPLTIIPMGTITDPVEQLIGKMDLDPSTGGTRFDWADFALAIQRPGVILLDEINRCPKNGSNILFSVLDGTATLVASGAKSTDQRNIKVNPDCVFFATANIGYEYTGTSQMDIALWNRFFCVELDYLSSRDEAAVLVNRTGISVEDANNISLIATGIRKSQRGGTLDHSVSTRETLMCAEAVRDGFELREALEICFLPNFEQGATDNDPNSERGMVKGIIASRFGGKQ